MDYLCAFVRFRHRTTVEDDDVSLVHVDISMKI